MNARKMPVWRIGFAVFSLIYSSCVVYLGLDNFDKVHSEYSYARQQLEPNRIRDIALAELAEKCRRESRREGKRIDRYRDMSGESSASSPDPCRSWPDAVVEKQQVSVAERLSDEAGKLKRRVGIFYITFAMFFLLLPLAFLYLLLSVLIWAFRGVRISR